MSNYATPKQAGNDQAGHAKAGRVQVVHALERLIVHVQNQRGKRQQLLPSLSAQFDWAWASWFQ